MNKNQIIGIVNKLLTEQFEFDSGLLKPSASLKDDLQLDSLDYVDVIVFVKETFGFKPLTEEMKKIRTLGDFYDYIEAHTDKG